MASGFPEASKNSDASLFLKGERRMIRRRQGLPRSARRGLGRRGPKVLAGEQHQSSPEFQVFREVELRDSKHMFICCQRRPVAAPRFGKRRRGGGQLARPLIRHREISAAYDVRIVSLLVNCLRTQWRRLIHPSIPTALACAGGNFDYTS